VVHERMGDGGSLELSHDLLLATLLCELHRSGSELIDILPVRLAMVLPQSDFERVHSIAFDFFTEAHLEAGAMRPVNHDTTDGNGATSDGGRPGLPGRRMPDSPVTPPRGPLGR